MWRARRDRHVLAGRGPSPRLQTTGSVVRALFLAPLPGRFGILVVPQAGALGFGLLFDFEVELAVFDREFAQVIVCTPRPTLPAPRPSSLFPGLCVPVDLYLCPQYDAASNIMLRRAANFRC